MNDHILTNGMVWPRIDQVPSAKLLKLHPYKYIHLIPSHPQKTGARATEEPRNFGGWEVNCLGIHKDLTTTSQRWLVEGIGCPKAGVTSNFWNTAEYYKGLLDDFGWNHPKSPWFTINFTNGTKVIWGQTTIFGQTIPYLFFWPFVEMQANNEASQMIKLSLVFPTYVVWV